MPCFSASPFLHFEGTRADELGTEDEGWWLVASGWRSCVGAVGRHLNEIACVSSGACVRERPCERVCAHAVRPETEEDGRTDGEAEVMSEWGLGNHIHEPLGCWLCGAPAPSTRCSVFAVCCSTAGLGRCPIPDARYENVARRIEIWDEGRKALQVDCGCATRERGAGGAHAPCFTKCAALQSRCGTSSASGSMKRCVCVPCSLFTVHR